MVVVGFAMVFIVLVRVVGLKWWRKKQISGAA
jgi:hypothetical protein